MVQRSQLPSDIATILLAAGSTICIQMASERLVLTLEEFFERPPCDYKTLLLSICIPCWNYTSNTSSGIKRPVGSKATEESHLLFEMFRAAPHPLGNAVAYLNSAFLAQISYDKKSGDLVIDNLQLAFGAYGSEYAIRASKVENFLVGKPVTASVLHEAIRLLRETIIPKEGTPHPSYRSSLAISFLFDSLHPLAKDLAEPKRNIHIDVFNAAASAEYATDSLNGAVHVTSDKASTYANNGRFDNCDTLLLSKQMMKFSKDYNPVGEPTKKVGAEIQAFEILNFANIR